MENEARTRILARARHGGRDHSAQQIRQLREGLGSAPAPVAPSDDLAIAFMSRLINNGASVACVPNRSAAVREIADFLYRHNYDRRLITANDPKMATLPWRDGGILPRFATVGDKDPVAASYGHLGIAETGSVLLPSDRGNPARNSFLVRDHVVLVDAADVVANYEQAWARIQANAQPRGLPRALHFISGPSSTADIVGHLVQGAHGPVTWQCIVIGQLPDDTLERARELAGK